MLQRAILALATLATLTGCGANQKPAEAKEEPEGVIGVVNATVVVDSCPDAKTMHAKAARTAIQKLVDPCSKVPGGAAHFSATLMPGGRIELASPSGDRAEGVVPTCVLENQLKHGVLLKNPCKFDVQLEERKIDAEPAPGTAP